MQRGSDAAGGREYRFLILDSWGLRLELRRGVLADASNKTSPSLRSHLDLGVPAQRRNAWLGRKPSGLQRGSGFFGSVSTPRGRLTEWCDAQWPDGFLSRCSHCWWRVETGRRTMRTTPHSAWSSSVPALQG